MIRELLRRWLGVDRLDDEVSRLRTWREGTVGVYAERFEVDQALVAMRRDLDAHISGAAVDDESAGRDEQPRGARAPNQESSRVAGERRDR